VAGRSNCWLPDGCTEALLIARRAGLATANVRGKVIEAASGTSPTTWQSWQSLQCYRPEGLVCRASFLLLVGYAFLRHSEAFD
jgi:hypothetical protein